MLSSTNFAYFFRNDKKQGIILNQSIAICQLLIDKKMEAHIIQYKKSGFVSDVRRIKKSGRQLKG